MRAITLLYHDVVQGSDNDSSGFRGGSAARYKLAQREFERHLAAISDVWRQPPARVNELLSAERQANPVLITFDDGGASATRIADLLDALAWKGHFLITTDYINTAGFVSAADIQDLHRRGHVIGSHTCSHPPRLSACDWPTMVREWQQSKAVLSDLIGERVCVASVPGGFYSREVARAASQAGLKALFTSEPTIHCEKIDDCLVIGRYSIIRDTTPETAAALAQGKRAPQMQQALLWNIKKVAKRVAGFSYERLRERVLKETTTPIDSKTERLR